jgi:hydrogenase maturation protease HycI
MASGKKRSGKYVKKLFNYSDLKQLFGVRPFVLLAVGSELRGDDSWTFDLIKNLQKFNSKESTFIWASTMPENFIKPISNIRPKRVIISDSADMGEAPGTVKISRPSDIADESYLSHRMPLKLTAQMLEERCGAEVWFLLMQPKNIEFKFGLSQEVRRSMEALCKSISIFLANE